MLLSVMILQIFLFTHIVRTIWPYELIVVRSNIRYTITIVAIASDSLYYSLSISPLPQPPSPPLTSRVNIIFHRLFCSVSFFSRCFHQIYFHVTNLTINFANAKNIEFSAGAMQSQFGHLKLKNCVLNRLAFFAMMLLLCSLFLGAFNNN